MTSMKKTALAAAVFLAAGIGAAEAAPVVNFNYSGTFSMLTPGGSPWNPTFTAAQCGTGHVCNDPALTGTMTMDFGTGAGSAVMTPSVTFSGFFWTAHNIQLQATGPGTVQATMLFDWNGNLNIPVTALFSMTPVVCNGGPPCLGTGSTFAIQTLDGDGDGIPGNAMASGPFAGFNATFGGTATVSSVSAVPVPAAVWLFGSGLLGLVGIARRKKAA